MDHYLNVAGLAVLAAALRAGPNNWRLQIRVGETQGHLTCLAMRISIFVRQISNQVSGYSVDVFNAGGPRNAVAWGFHPVPKYLSTIDG